MSVKIGGLVIQLEAWAREELGAQRELARLLEEEEQAVARNATSELVAASDRLQQNVRSGMGRDRRRRQILERLGSELGVAPATLTIGSIAERAEELGLPVNGLRALRGELRAECARVLRLGRRLSAVAKSHRSLLDEVFGRLAPHGDAEGRPVLLDARG